jgi:hypothetical protein
MGYKWTDGMGILKEVFQEISLDDINWIQLAASLLRQQQMLNTEMQHYVQHIHTTVSTADNAVCHDIS